MALSFSTCSSNLRLLAAKSKPLLPQPLHKLHLVAVSQPPKSSTRSLFYVNRTHHRRPCAQEKSNETSTPSSDKTQLEELEDQPQQSQVQGQSEEVEEGSSTEVAAELKQMLKEKREREQQDDSLLMGVAQEVREIEWPDLGRVLGTTGVVLAVIAGSTAALLSVNAILAELSDRVFAGKGIQDFF